MLLVFLLTAGSLAWLIAAGPDAVFPPHQVRHWAFQKITPVDPPAVKNKPWARNPIDAFVLAKLESKGLLPAPAADRITLIRRATFDLIGLPPTPQEVSAFLADRSPKAFEKVVDRLLASPQYGERWARHWLDLARYAESEGFKSDETRPNVWRYRDYVIRAFNSDKPYDRFIQEQIAGDELWPDDPDAHIATGFNRHYPDESNARNLMQRRQEILNDITDTVGSVFMGLTYGCARCHNHKYDPILQADYYRLQAFFAGARAADDIILAPQDEVERYRRQLAAWDEKTRDIRERMQAIEEPKRKEIVQDFVVKYPPEIQSAINRAPAERTPIEWQMYYKAKAYLDPNSHAYIASSADVAKSLKGEAKKQWEALKGELDKFEPLRPADLPIGSGIIDAGADAPPSYVLNGGVYDAKKEQVQPGFLTLYDPGPARINRPAALQSTGRRTALAAWLTDPGNPFPARVMINRVWLYHFGQGIVNTPSNFGLSGENPSDPKLLDWLANEFVRTGWSLKKMHRLIMTSNTYRQVSLYRAEAAKLDPQNRMLWRFPRQRLEAEIIRDASLAVAGMINLTRGGPSVFPELPEGMKTRGGWKVSEDTQDRNRRSIYIFVRRNTRYPMFETFDMPDTHESCARRNQTTTPLQALTMMNDQLMLQWAEGFAGRVLQATGANRKAQVELAYRLAYSRPPARDELQMALQFLDRQKGIIDQREAAGEKLAVPGVVPGGVAKSEAAALVDFCHTLLNSNEFLYRN
jgi:hypothetical protein